ncbi:MAG: PQQ-binding-like beta-propeller repeat protein, partial [Caldiserica bacterium]|nr:PQQ-binding-like beta-propeller repeat protein [Caldisericota bacterium]
FTDSKKLGMPIATQDNMFVTDNTGTIYCLTKTLGEELWRYNLGIKRPMTISLVGENIVFITTADLSNVFSGMGAGGRRPRKRDDKKEGPPGQGDIVEDEVKNFAGIVDATTGKLILKQELALDDLILSQSVIIGEKIYLVYISMDEKYNSGPSKIVCLSIKDLSTLWTAEFPKLIAMPLTVGDGKLITESMITIYNEETQQPEMKDAEITALKVSDGSVAWSKKLDANEVLVATSYADGVFYAPKIIMPEDDAGGGGGGGGRGGPFRMPDSYLSAYKASTGEQIWTTKVPAADPTKMDMGDLAFGLPSITPKGIIMQCMISKTICFEKDTGNIKWSTPTAGGMTMTGMQYVCTNDYVISTRGSKLSLINLNTGEEEYVEDLKFQAGMPMGGQMPTVAYPCIANDMIYIAADKLLAYGKKIVGIKSDPSVVRFEQIEAGQTKSKNVRVLYNGDGEIKGTASVTQPWMKLNTTDYKLAVQNYDLTIDATTLEPGEYKGEILIESTVGKASIPVIVRVVPKPPLKLEVSLEEETLTNVNPFKVKGVTVPGAKLTISGRPATVATDGSFTEDIPLKEGLNRLEFEAQNSKGAKAVAIRVIFLDTKKPVLQVSLSNDQVFETQAVKFSGRTEIGAKLRVNNEPVDVSETGEFEAVIENLEDGQHAIKIVATDKAGNVSTLERKITLDTKPLDL